MPERPLLDIARVELADDAGARKTVPFMDLIGPPRGYPNAPDRRALRALRRRVFLRIYLPASALGLAVTVGIALALGSLLFVPILQQSSWYFLAASAAMLLPLALLYEVTALPLFRRMYRRAFTQSALAERLCPFCLYDLSHAEASPLRCPECGARWRLTPPDASPPGTPPPDAPA